MNWPALPSDGFIAQRAATASDFDRSIAVFYQQSDEGETSNPFDVRVPQYAIWHGDDDESVPAILV